MRVAIVIVNWNGVGLLPACLDALEAQTRRADEIVVVDNGSTDGSVGLVEARYPGVRVLPLGRNLGLAGGTNAGIVASEGEIVVALNNDTIAATGWLEALVAPLEADPALGSTMSTMLFAHAPEWIASAGIAVYQNGLALEDRVGERWDARETTLRPIFGPSAGAAAYRRALLDDVGFFDGDFFMYLEDVDLAWRARLRGWSSLHVPAATIRHIYSASSVQGSPFKSFHLARNRLWSMRKCLPAGIARRHWPAIAAYDLSACAYALLTRDRASLRGRLAGLGGAHTGRKRRVIQARRTASLAALERWLLPSPSVGETLRLRRRVDRLSEQRTGDGGAGIE
jgi:GT2 family glycosyltransferase